MLYLKMSGEIKWLSSSCKVMKLLVTVDKSVTVTIV